MGVGTGLALKTLQWSIRSVQFSCAAVVLALYSFFLATLYKQNLAIESWVRAVEGISGAAVVYTILGLLLLCCLAGHPFISYFAITLDVLFIAGFVYVAVQNRGGAGSCTGVVDTPYGTGDASRNIASSSNGFTVIPNLHTACKMESACLAVSIVAIIFLVLSAFLEVFLVRHRRKDQRFGPGPANNYTSGYGKRSKYNDTSLAFPSQQRKHDFFVRMLSRRQNAAVDPNALPKHTHPEQVRQSYMAEQTRAGTGQVEGTTDGAASMEYEPGNGLDGTTAASSNGTASVAPAHYPPANYRYDYGVYNRV